MTFSSLFPVKGVCTSCNTRRMVETAAHLVEHVFPQLPVRQWVLSLQKRLRYVLRNDRRTVTAVLTIFLRVVEQVLRERAAGAAPKARLGALQTECDRQTAARGSGFDDYMGQKTG